MHTRPSLALESTSSQEPCPSAAPLLPTHLLPLQHSHTPSLPHPEAGGDRHPSRGCLRGLREVGHRARTRPAEGAGVSADSSPGAQPWAQTRAGSVVSRGQGVARRAAARCPGCGPGPRSRDMLGSCACRMASSRGLSGSLPPRWSKGGSSSSKCSAPPCPRQAPQVAGWGAGGRPDPLILGPLPPIHHSNLCSPPPAGCPGDGAVTPPNRPLPGSSHSPLSHILTGTLCQNLGGLASTGQRPSCPCAHAPHAPLVTGRDRARKAHARGRLPPPHVLQVGCPDSRRAAV